MRPAFETSSMRQPKSEPAQFELQPRRSSRLGRGGDLSQSRHWRAAELERINRRRERRGGEGGSGGASLASSMSRADARSVPALESRVASGASGFSYRRASVLETRRIADSSPVMDDDVRWAAICGKNRASDVGSRRARCPIEIARDADEASDIERPADEIVDREDRNEVARRELVRGPRVTEPRRRRAPRRRPVAHSACWLFKLCPYGNSRLPSDSAPRTAGRCTCAHNRPYSHRTVREPSHVDGSRASSAARHDECCGDLTKRHGAKAP
jgi:hypothetical protein